MNEDTKQKLQDIQLSVYEEYQKGNMDKGNYKIITNQLYGLAGWLKNNE